MWAEDDPLSAREYEFAMQIAFTKFRRKSPNFGVYVNSFGRHAVWEFNRYNNNNYNITVKYNVMAYETDLAVSEIV